MICNPQDVSNDFTESNSTELESKEKSHVSEK